MLQASNFKGFVIVKNLLIKEDQKVKKKFGLFSWNENSKEMSRDSNFLIFIFGEVVSSKFSLLNIILI